MAAPLCLISAGPFPDKKAYHHVHDEHEAAVHACRRVVEILEDPDAVAHVLVADVLRALLRVEVVEALCGACADGLVVFPNQLAYLST